MTEKRRAKLMLSGVVSELEKACLSGSECFTDRDYEKLTNLLIEYKEAKEVWEAVRHNEE